MKKTSAILALLLGALPVFATVSLGGVNYYTGQTYYSATGFEVAQSITVNHTGPADNFFVTVSPGGSGNSTARRVADWTGSGMAYQLYADTGTKAALKDLSSNPSGSEVLTGHFSGGSSSMSLSYYFAALAGLYPPSGYFTDTFTLTLYTGTVKNWTLVSSVNVQVAIQVNYEMNLSVVPTGGAFNQAITSLTFDFGVLTAGTRRTGDIVVKSNVPFKVSLSSMNGGVLRRTDQWENSQIPYTCTVDGTPVSLPANTNTVIGQGITASVDGTRFAVAFTIGDFWNVTSGTFSDTLQVTVSSQ